MPSLLERMRITEEGPPGEVSWKRRLTGWAVVAVVIFLLVRACSSFFQSNVEIVLRRETGTPDEIVIKNITRSDLSIIEISINGGQQDCKLKYLKPHDSGSDAVVFPIKLKAGSIVEWLVACQVGRIGIATDKGSDEYAVDNENAPLILNPDTRFRPGQKAN